MAAAASAASTALPPASSARTPARVASGWLVATIASAAIVGRRAQPEAPDAAANSRSFSIEGQTLAPRHAGYRRPQGGISWDSAVAKDFDTTKTKVAVATTLTLAARPVGAALLGYWADKVGRRTPLLAFTSCCSWAPSTS